MSYPPNRPINSWQSDTPSSPSMGDWQRQQDRDHLNLLSIFYYVMGGLHGLSALGIVFYVALFGTLIKSGGAQGPGPQTQGAAQMAAVFTGVGGFAAFLALVFTGLTIYTGYCIATRKNLLLIQVIAAFHCLSVPFGTALGIFTFIVLGRPSARYEFEHGSLTR